MKRPQYLRPVMLQRKGDTDTYFACMNRMPPSGDYQKDVHIVRAVRMHSGRRLFSQELALRIDFEREHWTVTQLERERDDQSGKIHALVYLVSAEYPLGRGNTQGDNLFAAKWIIATEWERWNAEGLSDKQRQARMESEMPDFPTMTQSGFKTICRELKLQKVTSAVTQNGAIKLRHKPNRLRR